MKFILLILSLGLVIFLGGKPALAATHDVSLSTTVQPALSLDITAGDTVAFGNLTPGNPIVAPDTGTVVTVSTNAANGYSLDVSDGVTGSGSALVKADGVTRITDVTSGTIALPAAWVIGTTGLGITLYAATTNKEAIWGTGITYDDSDNNYAAIPETATTAHTVTGVVVGNNSSSWAFKLDVPGSQATGLYSGTMTFTATAVLS